MINSTAQTQISFAQAEYEKKKKRTRREVFLEKMEQVVPWARLMEVIEPHYPKSGKRGRPPIGLAVKRRSRCFLATTGPRSLGSKARILTLIGGALFDLRKHGSNQL